MPILYRDKKLQVSLNIVRSHDPKLKNDFWLPMRELHLDIVQQNSGQQLVLPRHAPFSHSVKARQRESH